ncbi:MAG: hypothetical protein J2P37_09740 [Ktedonobacteraceae bacterium]|nr:hypothetical protein [Ktedonobacteraceae bacterium]MBO0793966.1 hypothetical protein [Ktedonobacteraceae bacterium]
MLLLGMVLLLAACAPAFSADSTPSVQSTPTIGPTFQKQLTAVPTVPPYRCGAWASNTAPSTFSTITIYARLTKDVTGVAGAPAVAVVHFKFAGDATLSQRPTSDGGGYVTFTLPLQGRQPSQQPTTVDVAFTVAGHQVQCTPAFFTPR